MKATRRRFLLLTLLLVLCLSVLFVSCGSSNGDGIYDAESPMSPEKGESGVISSDTVVTGDRKIIVTANFQLETKTFDETVQQIQDATAAAGGYISSSRVTPARDGDSGYASFTLRIPATSADSFSATLRGIGNVVSENESRQDVTLTYSDVQARIEVLRAEQTKLLELMDSAKSTSELLSIRDRYTTVSSDLASYEQQLRSLDNAVTYATFQVNLSDVKTYSSNNENFLVRFGTSFGKSFRSFATVVGNIAIALVYVLPYLLIAAVIVTVIIVVTKKKKKKNGGQPPRPTQPPMTPPPSGGFGYPASPMPHTPPTPPTPPASPSQAPMNHQPPKPDNKP